MKTGWPRNRGASFGENTADFLDGAPLVRAGEDHRAEDFGSRDGHRMAPDPTGPGGFRRNLEPDGLVADFGQIGALDAFSTADIQHDPARAIAGHVRGWREICGPVPIP